MTVGYVISLQGGFACHLRSLNEESPTLSSACFQAVVASLKVDEDSIIRLSPNPASLTEDPEVRDGGIVRSNVCNDLEFEHHPLYSFILQSRVPQLGTRYCTPGDSS